MSGVNKVILVGRMTRDPELRTTGTGKEVVNFGLATSEKYNGEEKTEFHNCLAWTKTATLINQYCKKGSQIYVEGKLQTSSWEKDGVKRYKTEIVVFQVQFLDSKPQGQSQPQQNYQTPPAQNHPAQDDFIEDSIQF